MHWEELPFDLPPVAGRTWARLADTSLPSPEDIVDFEQAPAVTGEKYLVNARSVVVLASKPQ
jgi:isoamylase